MGASPCDFIFLAPTAMGTDHRSEYAAHIERTGGGILFPQRVHFVTSFTVTGSAVLAHRWIGKGEYLDE
jgi:hypothetical protein